MTSVRPRSLPSRRISTVAGRRADIVRCGDAGNKRAGYLPGEAGDRTYECAQGAADRRKSR